MGLGPCLPNCVPQESREWQKTGHKRHILTLILVLSFVPLLLKLACNGFGRLLWNTSFFLVMPYVVQTLRICCDAWQCIFEVAYLFCETGVIMLPFGQFCVMIDAEEGTGNFYDNFAGTENDLNHVLSTFVDSEHEITNFCHSWYVDLSEVQSIFQNNTNEFSILTLNI